MRKHHCENTERPKPVQVSALLIPDNQVKVGLCLPSVQPGRNHRNDVHPTDEPTVRYTPRSAYGNQRASAAFGSDKPLRAEMASHSVYTEDFPAWDSPARVHPFCPCDNLKVNRELFATATTSRDSFCRRGPPVTARQSCRPAPPPPREVPPFDGTTSYSSQYRSHAAGPGRPPGRPADRPPGCPLTHVYTGRADIRGPPSDTARSFKPAAGVWVRSPASFTSTTEFKDQFRAWPLQPRVQPQAREYRVPEGDMALLSTTRADFREHRGYQRPPGARPARVAWVRDRPSARPPVRSTMKEDFRAWTAVPRLPVAPPLQELEWPRGPFAQTTTARASYTPKAAQRSLSYKPHPRPLNTGPSMEKESVYRSSFTAPRGPVRAGGAAAPPGSGFHSVGTDGTAPAERGVAGAGSTASGGGGGGGGGGVVARW